MKKLLLILVCTSPFVLAAQTCVMPLKQGTKISIAANLGKGKPRYTYTHEITSVSSMANGIEAKVTSTYYNKKGKEFQKLTDGRIQCQGTNLLIDWRLVNDLMGVLWVSEKSIDEVFIQYPAELAVDQKLPEGKVVYKMKAGSPTGKSTLTMTIFNRRVDRKETITTPAGTWEAFVITSDFDGKIGGTIGRRVGRLAEYVVPGVGIVRFDTIDIGPKAAIITSSVVTKIE